MVNNLLTVLTNRLTQEAWKMTTFLGKKTLSYQDVINGVNILFDPTLREQLNREGMMVVTRYNSSLGNIPGNTT